MSGSSRSWTPEKRARQAKIIRQRQPWQQSTGPKTPEGKDAVKNNAYKHGFRSVDYRELCALLRLQADFVKSLAPSSSRPRACAHGVSIRERVSEYHEDG